MGVKGVRAVREFVVCFVLAPGSLWFFFCKTVVLFLCSALRFSCVFFVLAPGSLCFGLWSTSCVFFCAPFCDSVVVFFCDCSRSLWFFFLQFSCALFVLFFVL